MRYTQALDCYKIAVEQGRMAINPQKYSHLSYEDIGDICDLATIERQRLREEKLQATKD